MSLQGYSQLQHRLDAVKVAPRTMLRKVAVASVAEAKMLVRRKTGFTGRSIRVLQVSEASATIVAGGAGVYLEHGTRPHLIRPVNGKALRWASAAGGRRLSGRPRTGAAVTFAKVVHHPGTKPYPFLLPGAQKAVARAGLADTITSAWNGAA